MSNPVNFTLAEENVDARTLADFSGDHLGHKTDSKRRQLGPLSLGTLSTHETDFRFQSYYSPFLYPNSDPSTYDPTLLSPNNRWGNATQLSPASTGYQTPSPASSRDFSVSPAASTSSPYSSWEESNYEISAGDPTHYNPLTAGGPRREFEMNVPSYSDHELMWHQGAQMARFMEEMNLGPYGSNDGAEFSQMQQLRPLQIPPQAEVHSPHQVPLSPNGVTRLQVGTIASRDATLRRRTGPPTARLFYCKIQGCGRDFTRQKNLTNHINSHYGIKPFHCPICDQAFVTKHTMTRHKKAKHSR